jgi:lysophospholipase L1-like esterase
MATLQSGQTISIQLAEGESYTVTPSGTAQVSTRGVSGSELSAPRTLTSAQTFGPYTEGGVINIACLVGTAFYAQAGGPVYQDPATGALVLAGGNYNLQTVSDGVVVMGDSIATFNLLPITASSIVDNGNGTATVSGTSLQAHAGDTISVEASGTTALNVLNAPVVSQTIVGSAVTQLVYSYQGLTGYAQSGTPLLRVLWRESDQGFFTIAKALSGARCRMLAHYTVGGSDSVQMEALLPQALANRPRAVVVQAGTNNVYARGWDATTSIASFKRSADAIAASGAVPVFMAILPRSDGQQSAANAARKMPVIRWMREYLPSIGGYFVDSWVRGTNGTTLADLTSAIGLANAALLVDGVHPNRLGAWAMGKALAPVLNAIFPERSRLPTSVAEATTTNTKLYFNNPLLTGAGGSTSAGSGTIVGTAPTGINVVIYAGSPTVTLSQVARTEAADGDAAGNWLRLVITGAASGTQVLVRAAVTPANFAYTDQVQGGMRVRTSSSGTPGIGNPSNMTVPEVLVNVTTATSGSDFAYAMANQVTGSAVDEAASMVLLTPPRAAKALGSAVHGSLSYIRLDMNLYFRGAGSATVDVAHPLLGAITE